MAPSKPVPEQAARPSWAFAVVAAGLLLAGGAALSAPGLLQKPHHAAPQQHRPTYEDEYAEPASSGGCAAMVLADVDRQVVHGDMGHIEFDLAPGCWMSYKLTLGKHTTGGYAFNLDGPGAWFTHTCSCTRTDVSPQATEERTVQSGTTDAPGHYTFTYRVEEVADFHFTAKQG